MRGGLTRRGYTIIEVMIFLAISGLMFVIAAAFVSGKEGAVQFRQSMNVINSQVQQVINNVINGYYPSSSNFSCSATAGIGPQFSSAGTVQGANGGLIGANGGCVFLGQVIQIGAGPTSASNPTGQDPTQYSVFTVAGSQYYNGGSGPTLPTGFSTANPTAVVNGANVDITQDGSFEGGMTATSMYNTDPTTGSVQQLTGIGFFGSFGANSNCNSSGTSTLLSGAQSLCIVGYPGTVQDIANGNTRANMEKLIDNGGSYAPSGNNNPVILNSPDITICFKGDSNQYGELTIGDVSGQHLATSVGISSTISAGCSS